MTAAELNATPLRRFRVTETWTRLLSEVGLHAGNIGEMLYAEFLRMRVEMVTKGGAT